MPAEHNIDSANGRTVPAAVLTGSLTAIVALHVIGTVFPVHATWGFNYWSLINPEAALPILGVAFVVGSAPVAGWLGRTLSGLWPGVRFRAKGRRPSALWVLGGLLVLTVLFFLRSRTLVYGDALEVVVQNSSGGGIFEGQHQYAMHLLSVLVNRVTVRALMPLGLSPQLILSALSSAAGVLGVMAIVRISRLLAEDNGSRWLICAAGLVSGSVVLFFGYIEYYTYATATALWTLYFTLRYLEGLGGRHLPIVMGVLSVLLHVVTLPFLVVALLVIRLRPSPEKQPFPAAKLYLSIAGIAFASGLAITTKQWVDTASIFVPVWPTSENPYWSFSPAHLLDLLNELLLVAPLAIPMVALCLLYPSALRKPAVRPKEAVLIGTAGLAFWAVFWIDPELGAPRDWDLLSFFGFPLAMWAAYRMVNFRARRAHRALPVVVTILLLVHLAPNLYEKNRPTVAIERLDGMLWQDPHYSPDYKLAWRGVSWGNILFMEMNRDDLAEKYFRRQLTIGEGFPKAWSNLGDIFLQREQHDSADAYFARALEHDSSNAYYYFRLSDLRSRASRYEEAHALVERAVALEPDDAEFRFGAALMNQAIGRIERAITHYKVAYRLDPHSIGALINAASLSYQLGHYDSAYVYAQQAVRDAPRHRGAHEVLLLVQVALRKFDEARVTLRDYEALEPPASFLAEFRSLIARGQQQPIPDGNR